MLRIVATPAVGRGTYPDLFGSRLRGGPEKLGRWRCFQRCLPHNADQRLRLFLPVYSSWIIVL
jgi:hypothetical protein